MRKIRRIPGLLLAAVMLLVMAVPSVLADDDGSITITNATQGQTYAAYKIFDAQLENETDGGESIVYFATEEQKTWYEEQQENPFSFSGPNSEGKYYVVKAAGKTDAEVIAFLQSFIDAETKEIDSDFAAQISKQGENKEPPEGTDQVVFEGLPYGYYLITSSLGATVTITSTNKDVEVKDKNQNPVWPPDPEDPPETIGKVIVDSDLNSNKESTADYGEEVKFKITVRATNYAGTKKITEYTIKDVIGAGFDYKLIGTDFKPVVKVGGTELADMDYTLEWAQDTKTFTVVIPWVDASQTLKYTSPVDITVEYSAILNENATIAGEGNKNTATFTYTDEDGNEETSPPDETTTYTYAIAVNKTDKDGAGLAGAEFTVSRNSGNLKFKEETPGSGIYVLSTADDASEKIVSPDGGVILIKGLKKGIYQLTETVAPEGYNPLTGTADIEVGKEGQSYDTSYTVYYDEDGNVTQQVTEHVANVSVLAAAALLNIVNFKGTELPSTGGMGTALFYLLGAALVAGALIMLFARRKRGRTE